MTAWSDIWDRSQASEAVAVNELMRVYVMKLAYAHVERNASLRRRGNEYVTPADVIDFAPLHSRATL